MKWILNIQVTGKHTNTMHPTTICEEDHKLATVCLVPHSGRRDSHSVQNKIVHFKSVFQHWLLFVETVYFVL